MPNQSNNEPSEPRKVLVCLEYSESIAALNRRTAAFPTQTIFCADCRLRLFITPTSLALLRSDESVTPLCRRCSDVLDSVAGDHQYAITAGQLRELAAALVRVKAQNN